MHVACLITFLYVHDKRYQCIHILNEMYVTVLTTPSQKKNKGQLL